MLDTVKAHVTRNKFAYIAGSVVTIAAVSYYFGMRSGSSKAFSPYIVGINNKLDQRVIILVERKGPPSWIIGKVGTDEEWISQRATAIAEGLRERDLRAHLNGKIDSLNGARYFRKGLASA